MENKSDKFSVDKVLSQIYKMFPDKFDPNDWKEKAESSFDALDGLIKQAFKGTVIMFVPKPDYKVIYHVYEYIGKNPFKAVKDFVRLDADELNFQNVKESLAVNLDENQKPNSIYAESHKGKREIIIVFPNIGNSVNIIKFPITGSVEAIIEWNLDDIRDVLEGTSNDALFDKLARITIDDGLNIETLERNGLVLKEGKSFDSLLEDIKTSTTVVPVREMLVLKRIKILKEYLKVKE